jgi:hypothetical protein
LAVSINQLVLPPELGDTLGPRLGVLEPPVLTSVRRVNCGVSRALRGLLLSSEQRLFELLRGKAPPELMLGQLVRLRTARRELTGRAAPVVRTAIQTSLRRLLDDEAYVDWFATNYAIENDAVTRGEVTDTFDRLRETVADDPPVPDVEAALASVAELHGAGVADVVEELTLDPPGLRTGSVAGDVAPARIEELDLTSRCLDVVDALSAVEFDPEAGRLDDLRLRLRERLDDGSPGDPDRSASGEESPAGEEFPLLDAPDDVVDESAAIEDPSLIGQPTGLAWLLTRSFEAGGLGAVVYPNPGAKHEWSWMVNPWVADRPVERERPVASVWQRAVFAMDTIDALFERARTGKTGPIRCPFCAMSQDRCGPDGCAFDPVRSVLNDRREEFVQVLRDVNRS